MLVIPLLWDVEALWPHSIEVSTIVGQRSFCVEFCAYMGYSTFLPLLPVDVSVNSCLSLFLTQTPGKSLENRVRTFFRSWSFTQNTEAFTPTGTFPEHSVASG